MKLVFKEYFCHFDLSHQLSAPLLGQVVVELRRGKGRGGKGRGGAGRQQLYSPDLGSVLLRLGSHPITLTGQFTGQLCSED